MNPNSPSETVVSANPVLKDRETMGHWASKKIERKELRSYQAEWNSSSLDGLPGLGVAMKDRGKMVWVSGLKVRGRRIIAQREALGWGFLGGMIAVWTGRVFLEFLSKQT